MIETSGHLPECPCVDGITPMYRGDCICDLLQACEQRVENRFHFYTGPEVYAKGYADGLDAAQEAIRNREDGEYFPWVQVEIALAAIHALVKEEKS